MKPIIILGFIIAMMIQGCIQDNSIPEIGGSWEQGFTFEELEIYKHNLERKSSDLIKGIYSFYPSEIAVPGKHPKLFCLKFYQNREQLKNFPFIYENTPNEYCIPYRMISDVDVNEKGKIHFTITPDGTNTYSLKLIIAKVSSWIVFSKDSINIQELSTFKFNVRENLNYQKKKFETIKQKIAQLGGELNGIKGNVGKKTLTDSLKEFETERKQIKEKIKRYFAQLAELIEENRGKNDAMVKEIQAHLDKLKLTLSQMKKETNLDNKDGKDLLKNINLLEGKDSYYRRGLEKNLEELKYLLKTKDLSELETKTITEESIQKTKQQLENWF